MNITNYSSCDRFSKDIERLTIFCRIWKVKTREILGQTRTTRVVEMQDAMYAMNMYKVQELSPESSGKCRSKHES